MNSPFNGNFRVSQCFSSAHDGLDLVGIDSKEIHSTVNGTVERAGWENAINHSQGFGQYVRIKKDDTNERYYFGHMSKVNVSVGQHVNICDVIGIMGNTGHSTGPHCHYCVRNNGSKAEILNVCDISGIPNAFGTYNDGYEQAPAVEPINEPTSGFNVGDTVRYRSFYRSSTDGVDKAIIKDDWRTGVITKVLSNGAHNPYLIDNGKCWINDGDIHNI